MPTLTPELLIAGVELDIIKSAQAENRNLRQTVNVDLIRDPVWRLVATGLMSMSDEQQESALLLASVTAKNVVSHLLGVLDGSSQLAGTFYDLVLHNEDSPLRLNGDLQTIFLADMNMNWSDS